MGDRYVEEHFCWARFILHSITCSPPLPETLKTVHAGKRESPSTKKIQLSQHAFFWTCPGLDGLYMSDHYYPQNSNVIAGNDELSTWPRDAILTVLKQNINIATFIQRAFLEMNFAFNYDHQSAAKLIIETTPHINICSQYFLFDQYLLTC